MSISTRMMDDGMLDDSTIILQAAHALELRSPQLTDALRTIVRNGGEAGALRERIKEVLDSELKMDAKLNRIAEIVA